MNENCPLCDKPLEGHETTNGIGLNTLQYHASCFRCGICKDDLLDLEHKMVEEVPVCRQHTEAECERVRVKRCTACEQPLRDQSTVYKGQHYHSSCIACASCGQELADRKGYEHEGKPHCKKCCIAQKQVSCRRCLAAITDKAIRTNTGEHVCQGCFKCTVFGNRCLAAITDKAIRTNTGEHVCQGCFTCTNCHRPIEKNYFELTGDLYCERCEDVFVRRQKKLKEMGIGS